MQTKLSQEWNVIPLRNEAFEAVPKTGRMSRDISLCRRRKKPKILW